MVLVEKFKNLPKEKKIAFTVFLGIVIIAFIAFIIMMARSGYLATTMRLLRVEGTVSIEDSKGGVKPVIDNIRFQSGDALSTGSDGIASIGLDDTKVVTLENDSRAEFFKRSKQLELKLTQGGLYFEVTEHLDDDETYEIKTSNMTVGIRGTSGYVFYDENGLESIVVTDGVVKITATNPATGEVKTIEIHGGQEAKVFMYSNKTSGDSVMFSVKDITEEDLEEFPLSMIVENKDLMKRICEYNNWSEEKLISLYNGIKNVIASGEQVELSPTPSTTSTPTPVPTVSGTPTPSVTPVPTDEPAPDDGNGGGDDNGAEPTTAPAETSPSPVSTFTVSFDANGHGTAPESQTVNKGSTASRPSDPEAEGYEFGGWYKNYDCTEEYSFDSEVNGNIVLYAKWIEITPETDPDEEPALTGDYEWYTKYVWGETYNGRTVYIICLDNADYHGYVKGEGWVSLGGWSDPPREGVRHFTLGNGDIYYAEEASIVESQVVGTT